VLYDIEKKLKKELDPLDRAYLMLYPVRRRIIDIMRSKGSVYIAQVADELGINPKVASFHIATLLQYKLVEGKWGTAKTDKGDERAVKYYSLTEEARESMRKAKEWLETQLTTLATD